jgi:hypothetical protein
MPYLEVLIIFNSLFSIVFMESLSINLLYEIFGEVVNLISAV